MRKILLPPADWPILRKAALLSLTGALIAGCFGITVLAGTAGYFAGPGLLENRPGWRDALDSFGVIDITAFNRVAGIHLGSHAGAFLGWITMMVRFVIAATPAFPSDARTHRNSSPSR